MNPDRRLAPIYGALFAMLATTAIVAVLVGPGDLNESDLRGVFVQLRSYRIAAAFLAGAALSVGGVMVQGLFRNPLASPSVLGTTAGASLGGQLAIIVYGFSNLGHGYFSPEMVVPLGCFAGAIGALTVLLVFLRMTEDLLAILLTGFILSALFLSIGSLLTSLSQERWELGRAVVSFSLGTVSGTGPHQLLFAMPLLGVALVACWFWSRPLDMLLCGEEEAQAMGANVNQVRWWTSIWVSVLVAGAVSVGGNVGFVGLVVPHMVRPFTGSTHARLIPASALAGGSFLVTCDIVARVIPARGEVPLGVVTGIVGAPIFLALLVRMRRRATDAA